MRAPQWLEVISAERELDNHLVTENGRTNIGNGKKTNRHTCGNGGNSGNGLRFNLPGHEAQFPLDILAGPVHWSTFSADSKGKRVGGPACLFNHFRVWHGSALAAPDNVKPRGHCCQVEP